MNFEKERERLIKALRARGIKSDAILDAFRSVPREIFVPADVMDKAYYDIPLPIFADQTISQPYTIAIMMELLDPQPNDIVLEIGTGSGYQAALLSRMVKHVYTIERIPQLTEMAQGALKACDCTNVTLLVGDGTMGYPPDAPYNGIIVTAGGPEVPAPLLEQLADFGRLVIPVGNKWAQTMMQVIRHGDGYDEHSYSHFKFVPLIGTFGWGS